MTVTNFSNWAKIFQRWLLQGLALIWAVLFFQYFAGLRRLRLLLLMFFSHCTSSYIHHIKRLEPVKTITALSLLCKSTRESVHQQMSSLRAEYRSLPPSDTGSLVVSVLFYYILVVAVLLMQSCFIKAVLLLQSCFIKWYNDSTKLFNLGPLSDTGSLVISVLFYYSLVAGLLMQSCFSKAILLLQSCFIKWYNESNKLFNLGKILTVINLKFWIF